MIASRFYSWAAAVVRRLLGLECDEETISLSLQSSAVYSDVLKMCKRLELSVLS